MFMVKSTEDITPMCTLKLQVQVTFLDQTLMLYFGGLFVQQADSRGLRLGLCGLIVGGRSQLGKPAIHSLLVESLRKKLSLRYTILQVSIFVIFFFTSSFFSSPQKSYANCTDCEVFFSSKRSHQY